MFEPITEEKLTQPRGNAYVQVYEDAWWPHDEEGNFFFYKLSPKDKHVAPQCNRNQTIAESVGRSVIPGYAGVKQLALAYVPIDVRDYQ